MSPAASRDPPRNSNPTHRVHTIAPNYTSLFLSQRHSSAGGLTAFRFDDPQQVQSTG